ncbi:MAG: tetratricopeptide repeat protein [Gammaproteobacteria bacterium]
MSIYDADTEQLDALKRWWKTNGRAVLVGLALGLAGVLAWSYWRSYTATQAEETSWRYDQLVTLIEAQDYAQAERHGSRLIEEFPASGYAGLASLLLAQAAVQAKDLALAKRHLQWAMEHAEGLEVARVARLRLARLLLHEQDYAEAIALLDGIEPASFIAPYEELRGDILSAQDNREAARTAYQKALAALPAFGTNRDRLQMKIDDLGTLKHPPAESLKTDGPNTLAKEPPA